MPKIDVYQSAFFKYLGSEMSYEALEELLTVAKAELDEPVNEEGIVKFELNDTNRPDLWSAAGLARQLNVFRGMEPPHYSFFSTPEEQQASGERRIVVDESVSQIRPYVAAFAVSGEPIGEAMLNDVIQTQEKLCWNYGRKRSSIAMGVYRSDLMEYPVHYRAVAPESRSFLPLGLEQELSLDRILTEHPKGQEFGHIVSGFDRYPLLEDANGDVLSFPPVINSGRIGAVEESDSELFIELTGTDMPSLLLACSIVACDLADAGFTVHPVAVEYPFDTPFGRTVVTPMYFQKPQQASVSYMGKLLGAEVSAEEAVEALRRMGIRAEQSDGGAQQAGGNGVRSSNGSDGAAADTTVAAYPPAYRNDFLHAVDLVEDVMIGHGMETFSPEAPSDFTVGRLTPEEQLGRSVRDIMVGLGYQEMLFTYLGSRREFVDRMYPESERQRALEQVVHIANPMSENYEYVRNSVIPHLLESESVSANAVYPHRIFEVGKTVVVDHSENYGSRTRNTLGLLIGSGDADFNQLNAHIAALLYYLVAPYELVEHADARFIDGRCAAVRINGQQIGIFGEVHPQVLENWGVEVPCAAAEFDLDRLLQARQGTASAE